MPNLKTKIDKILFPPPYPSKGSMAVKLWWYIKIYFMAQNYSESKRATLSFLEYNPDAKLLDLGCFDGKLTMGMARKIGTQKIFGIDRLDENIPKELTVYKGDLNDTFPISDGEFDVVCASHVIEHLSDTDVFLREIYRVLKPGGYTVISTDNLASWHNIVYLILSRQPEPCTVSDEMGLSFKRFEHRRIFTIPSLTKLLKYHGFEVQMVKGSAYYPLPTTIARIMARIDRWHSRVITVKAKKIGGENAN